MFTYVKLKNYKSLVDFEVDLTDNKKNTKKFIIIYGENGAGKTNFINAFSTLSETINTKIYKNLIDKFIEKNLDKKDNVEILNEFIKNNLRNIEDIINDAKTIDSKENMSLEFGFRLNGKDGKYYIEMGKNSIVRENLEYVLSKNKTQYFDISNKKIYINKSLFNSNKYFVEISDLIDKFWGKHSFLSIILSEMIDKNESYIYTNIPKKLKNIIEYFLSLTTHIGDEIINYKSNIDFHSGSINKNSKELLDFLDSFETYIDMFFTDLYSDIKQVFYKKEYIDDDIIDYKLFVKKQIYGKLIDIDFSLESGGTKKLAKFAFILYRYLNKNRVALIDELDSGIHDFLFSCILKDLYLYLYNKMKGQLIITTHNTTLLETEIKKDYIYLFNIDSNGKKILIPITEYEREHPNTNFRKRYLKGLYGGIPMIDNIDFDDLLNQED